jgi:hypothetical protein
VTSICLTGKEELAAIPFNRYFPQRTYGVVERKGKIASPQAVRFIQMLNAKAHDSSAHMPEKIRKRRVAPDLASQGAE